MDTETTVTTVNTDATVNTDTTVNIDTTDKTDTTATTDAAVTTETTDTTVITETTGTTNPARLKRIQRNLKRKQNKLHAAKENLVENGVRICKKCNKQYPDFHFQALEADARNLTVRCIACRMRRKNRKALDAVRKTQNRPSLPAQEMLDTMKVIDIRVLHWIASTSRIFGLRLSREEMDTIKNRCRLQYLSVQHLLEERDTTGTDSLEVSLDKISLAEHEALRKHRLVVLARAKMRMERTKALKLAKAKKNLPPALPLEPNEETGLKPNGEAKLEPDQETVLGSNEEIKKQDDCSLE